MELEDPGSSPSYPLHPPGWNERGRPEQQPNFLEDPHYATWARMFRKSHKQRVSLIKFILQLLTYTGETCCLAITLVTGVVIPTNDALETWIAVGLWILTWVVTVRVTFVNEQRSRRNQVRNRKHELLWMVAMFPRPVRYCKEFRVRNRMLAIMKRESGPSNTHITEAGLQALSDLTAKELEGKRVELYETFFQGLLMCFLQTYFLFRSYQSFKLCDIGDLSRLGTIGMTILQAARSASEFESSKSDYEAATHFLTYYKSEGAIPMRVDTQDVLSLTGLFNLLQHISTIALRFYVSAYLLAKSPILSLTYLTSVFTVNAVLLYLFPTLREVHENPPLGVPTGISYWTDRYMNTFCNVSTRFTKFTSTRVRLLRVRLPLVLIQAVHFVVPLLAVYGVSSIVQSTEANPTNNMMNMTLPEVLEDCPDKLSEWYGANSLTRTLGDYLFDPYKQIAEKFTSYNDIFNMFHVIWLLFYTQLVSTIVYAYAVKEFNLWENYPAVTGYSFWTTLFECILSSPNNNEQKHKTVTRLNQLMLLTLLKDEQESTPPNSELIPPLTFGKFTRSSLGLFPRESIPDGDYDTQITRLVSKLTESDAKVDELISGCFRAGHVLTPYFRRVHDALFDNAPGKVDKRLFFIFFNYFDRKMVSLSSHKVATIFRLLQVTPSRTPLH